MATISVRVGPNWGITPVSTPLAVLQAIQSGGDVLVDGQTATLTNSGGNWFVNGQPVSSLFTVATGPTTVPPDTLPGTPIYYGPGTGPGSVPSPVIRTDPFPGPTTVPPDTLPGTPIYYGSGTGPGSVPSPVIRTDPFPVTAAGSLNLTPGTLIILAAAAYFIFFRRSS